MKQRVYGFTIVELLIVIVVIGILAAITVVAFNGIQNRAHNTTVESDLAAAAKQLEMLRTTSENTAYPGLASAFPAGFKFTKSAYLTDNSTHNVLYCLNKVTDSYALYVVAKSGQRYTLHDGEVSQGGSTDVCSVVGTTWKNDSTTAVIHGYHSGGTAWYDNWSWTAG